MGAATSAVWARNSGPPSCLTFSPAAPETPACKEFGGKTVGACKAPIDVIGDTLTHDTAGSTGYLGCFTTGNDDCGSVTRAAPCSL